MRQERFDTLSLEEVAFRAVALGREVSIEAHRLGVGGTAKAARFVVRALGRSGERDPFFASDTASLEAVRGYLARDLEAETIRIENIIDEDSLDMDGLPQVVRQVPVRTKRGNELAVLSQLFESFVEAREVTMDRVAAEKALVRLLE